MRVVAISLILVGCATSVPSESETYSPKVTKSNEPIGSDAYGSQECGDVFERIVMGGHIYMIALPCDMEYKYIEKGDPPSMMTGRIELGMPSVQSR